VPLAQANPSGDQVQVPYEKQLIKDAPKMDPDGHLTEAEEQQLWRHYGLDYGAGYTDTAAQGRATEATLREETPVVEKTTVPRERVRLDTETVTDERQVAEEVRKEQIDVDDQSGRARRPPR
jgi:hypothetical protein